MLAGVRQPEGVGELTPDAASLGNNRCERFVWYLVEHPPCDREHRAVVQSFEPALHVRVLFIGWTSAAGGGIPTRRRRQPARTPEVGYSTSAMVSRSFSRLMRGTYQVSQ